MKWILPVMLFLTSMLQAQNKKEPAVQEFTLFMFADDWATVRVNGNEVLFAAFPETKNTKVNLRKGDIITISVEDRQGGKGGALRAYLFQGNSAVVTSADFRYQEAPDRSWMTTPSMFGFKSPQVKKIGNAVLENVKNVEEVWAQPQDQKFARLFFKYVMP